MRLKCGKWLEIRASKNKYGTGMINDHPFFCGN
jgi:hypothetical protein